MDRTRWGASILLILVSLSHGGAQEGRLQRIREDVRSSGAESRSSEAESGSSEDWSASAGSYSDPSTTESDEGLDAPLLGMFLFAPFYVPAAILHDDYQAALDFAPHPYAHGYRGYQMPSVVGANLFYDRSVHEAPRKKWAVRVAVEDGDDFAGMNRLGGQLKIEHASRWGILTSWNGFQERLAEGRSDQTVIGDANLTFRFAQNEVASMYAGLGLRVLTDRQQSDFGVNFVYGGDWFPVRPIVVSASFDAGTLGSAGVLHGRGTIGAVFHGWEVFAGYDFLRIGETNLQGPLAGIRLWF